MSFIYWVGNIKTNVELVLLKHGILSSTAQEKNKNIVEEAIGKLQVCVYEWALVFRKKTYKRV